jgi:hypothetical protein
MARGSSRSRHEGRSVRYAVACSSMQPGGRKRSPVRFAELRRRAVNADLAAQTAGSAHGPWRLADSPALSIALPNAYFDSLGIPRLTVKPIA